MKVIVLGAGLVGGPIALDLAGGEFAVTVADIDAKALARLKSRDGSLTTREADLSDGASLARLIADQDLVLCAVPGFMGYSTLETVIAAGRNVVDISFFPENAFDLDGAAKANGVCAIVDAGVAPGLSNLLAAHAMSSLDETESILIYVGGLPEIRRWPYEYCAVFSPIDVIEEYTRPARYVEGGRIVVRPALSDPELIDFPGIGTLEAFNTDGLRSLAETLSVANMKEKTLRYPGHIEKMRLLRESGFFSAEAIDVKGVSVRPIDLTARLLFPMWKLGEGEADITVMQVIVEGKKDGVPTRRTFDLNDRYDPVTDTHSMARTTGYTATMLLRALAQGLFREPGIHPPEILGRDAAIVDHVLAGLAQRGIHCEATVSAL